MASVIALRAILSASLGLGTLDLVWINVSLAPALGERGPATVASADLATRSPTAAEQPQAAAAGPRPTIEAVPSAPRDATDATDARVYFATTSVVIDAEAKNILRRVARRAGATATIVLDGHADHRGDEAFNRTLSKQRAIAVRNYLARLGIRAARIHVGFDGEGQTFEDAELWRDRRVDIQITGGP